MFRRRTREKGHIKDIYCIHCETVTKNYEIRREIDFCNETTVNEINRLHNVYYNNTNK